MDTDGDRKTVPAREVSGMTVRSILDLSRHENADQLLRRARSTVLDDEQNYPTLPGRDPRRCIQPEAIVRKL